MNNYKNIVPFFKLKEGGLSRHSADAARSFTCPTPYNGVTGYHTNKGITYKVWVAYFGKNNDARFYAMSDEDWLVVFKKGYWDKVKGDDATYQCLADVLVSWAWGSGAVTAIRQLQGMLIYHGYKVERDGKLSKNGETFKTCAKIEPTVLFKMCVKHRESFFRMICDPSNTNDPKLKAQRIANQKNLKGWLNRLEAFSEQFHP